MDEHIISNVISIDKNIPDIESELNRNCNGKILRWAIVDVGEFELKICYSYKTI